MASPIAESWIYATMLIENEWSERGTGFLVFRAIDDKSGRIFLVTNKHVLHKKAEMRRSATRVILYLNIKNADGSITGQTADLPLNLDDGSKCWREHPDKDVDVLAFDVTIGDEILVIGYPLGLRQGATNFPLLRGGIIATRIGESNSRGPR